MSPTAFKQHVTQLLSDLQRCIEFTHLILENRRVGSKHEALDNLRDDLKNTATTVTLEYNTLRKIFGSRMDLGDEISRHALKSAIRSIEYDVQSKLSDIANRRNDGLPGFRDMSRHVKLIEQNVSDVLESFAQRLERPVVVEPIVKPSPKPTPKPASIPVKPKKADDVVIQLKELERYTEHMKNCWAETIVTGKILYVNQYDERKNTWEKPIGGFIKTLPVPPPSSRRPTWNGARVERDEWTRPSGW